MHTRTAFLGMVSALSLSGCAGRAPGGGADPGGHALAVEIENRGWSDVVIYLVRGSSVARLGTVGSLRSETFVFPYRRLGAGEARLRARPVGGPAPFTSEQLQVRPGQSVKWMLESDLSRSFLAVY